MKNTRDINTILAKGKIIEKVNLSNNYHKIKIKAPQIAKVF